PRHPVSGRAIRLPVRRARRAGGEGRGAGSTGGGWMKALVTGSTGFIGRHLVAYLRAAGHAVDLLGRSPGPGVVQADLAAGAPTLARGGYDVVYHVAGKAHVVPRTEAERQAFFAVNAAGTKHLLDALDAQERPPGAFVLVSTVAVYG